MLTFTMHISLSFIINSQILALVCNSYLGYETICHFQKTFFYFKLIYCSLVGCDRAWWRSHARLNHLMVYLGVCRWLCQTCDSSSLLL